MMEEEKVIWVDECDRELGTLGKMEAHRAGILHRAVSVFLMDSRGRMLLQRRAVGKYHSAGLWSNACCSHPRPGESAREAAARRLKEEMGITVPLREAFSFQYKAAMENGLTEHEFDHVFTGSFEGTPALNYEEADAWMWMTRQELADAFLKLPEHYTAWFRMIALRVFDQVNEDPNENSLRAS